MHENNPYICSVPAKASEATRGCASWLRWVVADCNKALSPVVVAKEMIRV
jgi:hypothetical protein